MNNELSNIEQFYADDGYDGFSNTTDLERYRDYANFVLANTTGQVIEIGSGRGLAAVSLKDSGVDVTASDIFTENAKKTFSELGRDINVIELNVNKIHLHEQSVSNFCLYQVLEHIEDPRLAVREIYKTLKPGGHFIVVGPNLISPFTSLKAIVMTITGKWKGYWFKRDDGYSFPFGDTIPESIMIFLRNIFLSLLKFSMPSFRKPIFRDPCLTKPAVSDSDAVYLMNPLDTRQLLEDAGFVTISYQTKRKLKSFAGSTWIVARKN